jgi:hypothetical protein
METFTNASMMDYVWGFALGYVGYTAYVSYKAGQFNPLTPEGFIYLLKSDPIPTLIPLIGGFLGYRYFSGSTPTYLYGGAIAGGALGTMLAPMIRTGA